MKSILTMSAVSLALIAGAAGAMTKDTSFTAAQIHAFAPDVDVSALSDEQILTVLSIIHSSEDGGKAQRVWAYLN